MAYIKSHSNYVIKDKHQLTNNGTILERDIATVGGLNKFALGQVPIYSSGNFIITINNDNTVTKNYDGNKWDKTIENNSEVEEWTLENIEPLLKNEKQNSIFCFEPNVKFSKLI